MTTVRLGPRHELLAGVALAWAVVWLEREAAAPSDGGAAGIASGGVLIGRLPAS